MKPRILVLDDQLQYLRSLARAFQAEYDFSLVRSLDEALATVSDNFDIVLSDLCLTEPAGTQLDGLVFVRHLRTNFPNLPVIAMSALELEGIKEKAMAAGATAFLSKPIRISNLRSLLIELTANRKHAPDTQQN